MAKGPLVVCYLIWFAPFTMVNRQGCKLRRISLCDTDLGEDVFGLLKQKITKGKHKGKGNPRMDENDVPISISVSEINLCITIRTES